MLNLRGWAQNSPRKVSLFCQFCCTFAIEHQRGANRTCNLPHRQMRSPGLINVLFRSSKSAFSRHDDVRASSTLFIWLNENVLFRSSKSAFSRHDNVRASSTLFIWLNKNVPNHMAKKRLDTRLTYLNCSITEDDIH